MLKLLFAAALLFCTASAQQQAPVPVPPAQTFTELRQALLGNWVGLLEYRDFSEPATSTKREQLPTWLSISDGPALAWHYIYDDGPAKVVEETDLVTFDPATSTYSEVDDGKPAQIFKVSGYDKLRNGRGVLVLTGNGTDNGKPSETRITMTIRRNYLEVLQETRLAGSADPFLYRHLFRFTRATSPSVSPAVK